LTRVNGLVYFPFVTSDEFLRWLQKQGCVVYPARGKGGHVMVVLGDKHTFVPRHGSAKEVGTGLERKIKRDLGLK
jgi:mRNA interferase HicA